MEQPVGINDVGDETERDEHVKVVDNHMGGQYASFLHTREEERRVPAHEAPHLIGRPVCSNAESLDEEPGHKDHKDPYEDKAVILLVVQSVGLHHVPADDRHDDAHERGQAERLRIKLKIR